jgi:Predicted membrane protein
MASELEGATRLAIAALIGLGVGVEREWSGHTSGPDARFAGIRTFLLLGFTGGGAGLLAAQGLGSVALGLVLGGAALSVGAYVVATHRKGASVDATTETAALAVLALAALAGMGWLIVAAAAGSLIVLALSEKTRLHALVRRVSETELHAALQFAVLAVVILPLLPAGPIWGPLEIRPRTLWTVVLLFCALDFAGYIARRTVGLGRGYGITGALGGLISSTAVTFNFSRQSAVDGALGIPLARGVIAACTVLVPRVLVVSAILNPSVAIAVAPFLLPPFVLGLAIVLVPWRSDATPTTRIAESGKSPLRLGNALRMAAAFQVAITVIAFVQSRFGATELYGTAALLGLTDVDALTVSMSDPKSLLSASIAARALAIGVLANTCLKLCLAVILGRTTYRRATAAGLIALAATSAVALVLF